ncbi:MAG TPA: zinc-binding dehydrogenase [Myxococcota bacterium]|jgi:NADPH2:quinone reductase|nr:zinc-binding dehydrogenase [Myxococcota bacterium]
MTEHAPKSTLEIRSTIKGNGTLELRLEEAPLPALGENDVLVRVEASPINPSDLGLLFGPADMTSARLTGSAERPIVSADVPEKLMHAVRARVDQSLPVGNEGAGVVIGAGASPAARSLLGKTVGLIGGGMYTQFRVVGAAMCLQLEEGTTPAEGASCFVNPLTALGMVETMKLEGHTALVHTAAASNLGQMLQKLCLKDGVALVNVVRRPEQALLLEKIGAAHVCDSSKPGFEEDLIEALVATGATLAFDATGGGKLAGQILACMEAAAGRSAREYSRYGSEVHKQVYIYGGLDRSPTILNRNFGMAWGVGGWLLTPFLKKVGFAVGQALRARVAAEIKTTFASAYSHEVSLARALQLDSIAAYGRQGTGNKFLITPHASP